MKHQAHSQIPNLLSNFSDDDQANFPSNKYPTYVSPHLLHLPLSLNLLIF